MYTESKALLAGPTTLHTATSLCHGRHLCQWPSKVRLKRNFMLRPAVFLLHIQSLWPLQKYMVSWHLYHHSLAWKGQISVPLDCTVSECSILKNVCLHEWPRPSHLQCFEWACHQGSDVWTLGLQLEAMFAGEAQEVKPCWRASSEHIKPHDTSSSHALCFVCGWTLSFLLKPPWQPPAVTGSMA